MESKPGVLLIVLTRFLHANRYPLRSKTLSFSCGMAALRVDCASRSAYFVPQSALGRLLSAARELASTQSNGLVHSHPSSGLSQRTSGNTEGRYSMSRTLYSRFHARWSQERSQALAESASRWRCKGARATRRRHALQHRLSPDCAMSSLRSRVNMDCRAGPRSERHWMIWHWRGVRAPNSSRSCCALRGKAIRPLPHAFWRDRRRSAQTISYIAVATGDLEAVKRRLAADPVAATRKAGHSIGSRCFISPMRA